MRNECIPRIVISGLRGGSGKTVLSLSLLCALKKKGIKVQAFKKGPDYIDAGWLAKASGSPCYNLDLFMMTPDQALLSFVSHSQNSAIAVIEGNRGLYDGMDHRGTYSTAGLAKVLKAPVLLITDCTKTTSTVAAMVLGCQQMDPDVIIAGVVLNRVATGRQESVIRKALGETCRVPVLGAIPRLQKDPFPERHMGLTPFQEHRDIEESLAAVEDIGSRYLDLDGIREAALAAGELKAEVIRQKAEDAGQKDTSQKSNVKCQKLKKNGNSTAEKRPLIGIVRDSAFQFYYEENFEELVRRGAEIREVSPLREESLPEIDALYIGGGFPETHAIALAENLRFRESLLQAIQKGLPVYAECGGLMYLGRELLLAGKTYPMVDALPIVFGLQDRPLAHGYTVVEVEKANPYFPEKAVFKGHEFHYSRVLEIRGTEPYLAFAVRRGKGLVDNKDGICYKNVFATYTHLHAIGTPEWADGMVRIAGEQKNQRSKMKNQN